MKRGMRTLLKRILIALVIFSLWCSSIAFAYVYGGSNLGFNGYPAFSSYLSYSPSRYEIEQYISDAKEYVENCSYDIQRIQEAQTAAIDEANNAIHRYNNGY